jgi:hypothetical protein
MKKNTPRTIDSYIEEAKTDILIYFFVYFALIIGVIALAYIEQEPFICCLTILFLLMFLQRIFTYNKINSIKKKIDEQGSLDKVQNIVFWNNNHYFLTEEYFVILNKKDIDIFSYQDIKTIQKEIRYNFGSDICPPDYLYLTLNNGKKYKIIIRFNQQHFSLQEAVDISEFLLSKNKDIIEEELIIKIHDKKI